MQAAGGVDPERRAKGRTEPAIRHHGMDRDAVADPLVDGRRDDLELIAVSGRPETAEQEQRVALAAQHLEQAVRLAAIRVAKHAVGRALSGARTARQEAEAPRLRDDRARA